MARGYVYIMDNPAMPDLYKVGCTSRTPQLRASELSASSGVPAPFKVLCQAGFQAFQQREHELHRFLSGFRFTAGREFFEGAIALREAATWLFFNPGRVSFSSRSDLLTDEDLLGTCGVASLNELLNPWKAVM